MRPETRTFQEAIIRSLKGMLAAWETWLRKRSQPE